MFLGESERFGSAEQEEFANVLYWGTTVGPITFFNEFLNPMAFCSVFRLLERRRRRRIKEQLHKPQKSKETEPSAVTPPEIKVDFF